MITAHIPSGYILARSLGAKGAAVIAAIAGATFPDLDLLWFYLIDDRAFHHHKYWVHAPAFVLLVSACLISALRIATPRHTLVGIAFALGWCLHVILDSPVGGTMWFWPFDDTIFTLVTVPATQSHWLLSFILHWSFLAEVGIWSLAFWLYFQKSRSNDP